MRHVVPALAAAALLASARPASAEVSPVRIDAGVVGGTIAEWGAFDEAGNAFGLAAGAHFSNVRVTAAVARVLPDGRAQAQFTTFWVEGQWHPLLDTLRDRRLPLSPYGLVGFGVGTADQAGGAADDARVRWGSDGPEFVAMLGVGVRYGAPTGLYVAVDLRGTNVSHAGLTLAAGWVF